MTGHDPDVYSKKTFLVHYRGGDSLLVQAGTAEDAVNKVKEEKGCLTACASTLSHDELYQCIHHGMEIL